jgi:hypothetical protein
LATHKDWNLKFSPNHGEINSDPIAKEKQGFSKILSQAFSRKFHKKLGVTDGTLRFY